MSISGSILVSVIIPTYNRSEYLKRAINSVLNQTMPDYEIIIVDDGSTDDTERVVRKYADKRIRYVKHRQRKGGSAARNTGILAARGSLIAFLDDDDEWLPRKLELQVKRFEENIKLGAVYTGYFIRYGGTNGPIRKIVPKKRGNIYKALLIRNVVGTASTVMVRAECFFEVGMFDDSLPSSQDADMWRRLSRKYEFDYVEIPLVIYNAHFGNRVSGNYRAAAKACEIELEKFSQDLKRHKRIHSIRLLKYAKLLYLAGDQKKGRSVIKLALKLYPPNLMLYPFSLIFLFGDRAIRVYMTIGENIRKIAKLLLPKQINIKRT